MNQIKKIHGHIRGPLVMIGFGSIGRGMLPLIERHFTYPSNDIHVIDPSNKHENTFIQHGIHHHQIALTPKNFHDVLDPLMKPGAFCVNLSVDVSSVDVMKLCRKKGALYIDTVNEPWAGFYFDTSIEKAKRTNYALRESLLAEKRAYPGGPTAVSCCGANPGMVSWFVKAALVRLAKDMNVAVTRPETQEEWALLMMNLGVKGVHIAERDTQSSAESKAAGVFVNTWSVDGFITESFQPAELGWGTHERHFPTNAHKHNHGCQAAIYLDTPGILTKVHTWTPAEGPQIGFLVTHNEAISISDYYTVKNPENRIFADAAKDSDKDPVYRPTCNYAYHPCGQAILSLHETLGLGRQQDKRKILEEYSIITGGDHLGVLLYGHEKNALWYGSRLDIDETRELAPYQNATGLQVTSAVLAGMVWALENPEAGIVETDEMDYERCLEIQSPYLGSVEAHYTDWTPLSSRWAQLEENIDKGDPWQFRNIIAA